MLNIAGAFLGTVSIFASNAVLAIAFTGLGLALRRAFGLVRVSLEDCFLAFWVGFGVVLLFLMIWNFFLPVGQSALLIVLVAGLTGAAVARRTLHDVFKQSLLPGWSWAVMVVAGLWIANMSLDRMTNWDTALYHMQGVLWAGSYPVVPGLANLFGPLGFNNSSFLYNAMLDAGPWQQRAWHVSNGILVWVLAARIIASLVRLTRGGDPASSSMHLFALLVFPAVFDSARPENLANFSTASATSLVLLVIGIQAYLVCCDEQRTDRERAYDYFCIAALAAIAVSIKLCATVFAIGILAMSVHGALRRVTDRKYSTKAIVWALMAVGAIGLAWSARGVVLSGYPLFPSRILSVPVDWRVPSMHARAEYDFVVHSALVTARNSEFVSGKSEGIGAWFPNWLAHAGLENYFTIAVPSGLAVLALLVLVVSYQSATESQKAALHPGWIVLAPVAVALVAWAVIAPMPQYGTPFFWILAALIGSQAFRLRMPGLVQTRIVIVAGCLLSVSPAFVTPIRQYLQAPASRNLLIEILAANLVVPEPEQWFKDSRPQMQLSEFTTRSGLKVKVPEGPAGRCWDTAVPCTPNPAPNLELRVPGHLEHGFKVNGDWQMQNWPERWQQNLLPALREAWKKQDG
jgi:hypothetical protein